MSITAPPNNFRAEAVFDDTTGGFVAQVPLAAEVSDPDGDRVDVVWLSPDFGVLGEGRDVVAAITVALDSAATTIVAVARDGRGNIAVDTVNVLFFVPSG